MSPTTQLHNSFPFLMRVAFCYLVICPFAAAQQTEHPGSEGNGNFVIGPAYKIDPDLQDQGNPKGKAFEFSMKLSESKIFRGDDKTLIPRRKYGPSARSLSTYRPLTKTARKPLY